MPKTIRTSSSKNPRNPLNTNKIFANPTHNPLKRIHFRTAVKGRPLPTHRIRRRDTQTSQN